MTRVVLSRPLLLLQTPLGRSTPRNALFHHSSASMRGVDWQPNHISEKIKNEERKPAKIEHERYNSPRSGPILEQKEHATRSLRVNDVARKFNLGFPSDLQRLGMNQSFNKARVRIFYSKRHLIDRNDMNYLDKSEHPYAGSVLERYTEWSDGSRPLWWSVNSFGDASPFVCTTAQRLLNRGIRLGLEDHGFDRFGRKLVERGQEPPLNNPSDLFGTLRVLCPLPKELCQLDFEHIAYTGQAIIAELVLQLTSENGRPPPESKRQISKRQKMASNIQHTGGDASSPTSHSISKGSGSENGASSAKNMLKSRDNGTHDSPFAESRTLPASSRQVSDPSYASIVRKVGPRGLGPLDAPISNGKHKSPKARAQNGFSS